MIFADLLLVAVLPNERCKIMPEPLALQIFGVYLSGFTLSWFYCYNSQCSTCTGSNSDSHKDKLNAWVDCYALHDFSDMTICIFAICSLLQKIEEYHVLSFALAYFIVDLFDCIIRKDWMFL